MEYKGKLYAKVGGKFIECTETVQQLESRIKELESEKICSCGTPSVIHKCKNCNGIIKYSK